MPYNFFPTVFRFVTIHACDRQTDGQTEFSSLDRVCIPRSAVKNIAVGNFRLHLAAFFKFFVNRYDVITLP